MKAELLDQLRDRKISIENFRKISLTLSKLIALEIFQRIDPEQRVVLVAILRAGLVLLPAFQDQFMGAPIGLIGIRRDEKTALPHLYYEKLPPLPGSSHILIFDPMLATGGSANLAINLLKAHGKHRMTLISMIAAPQGIELIQKGHPEVSQYTASIDKGLDQKKYIVPGLGDFGDRYFGTI